MTEKPSLFYSKYKFANNSVNSNTINDNIQA